MAIKKRVTPVVEAPVAKKAKIAKPNVAKQCAVIEAALLSTKKFPDTLCKMLAATLPLCLGVPKESRHRHQDTTIEMIGEILDSVQADISKRGDNAEAQIASASARQESQNKAQEVATSEVADTSNNMNVAKVAFTESATGAQAAKAALSETEAARAEGDGELDRASGKKAKLETLLSESVSGLKSGSFASAVSRSHIAAVMKLGKEIELDQAMLSSLPTALAKTPVARGTFDNMVLEQLEGDLQKHITALEQILATGETAKIERAAKVETARVQLETAQNNLTRCQDDFEQSKNAVEEAKARLKAAAQAVSHFGPEMKQVEKDLATAKADMVAFKGGALAAYKELLEFTAIPPPPESPMPASSSQPAQ